MKQGDPNASIPTIEPMIMRPQFGVCLLLLFHSAISHLLINENEIQAHLPSTSITFVSQASIDEGVVQSYGLRKRIEAVKNCRSVGKKDMKYNDAMPKMKVDPESYVSMQ